MLRRALVTDRIEEILGEGYTVGENDTLTYSWTHGYERLVLEHKGGGGLHFEGAYHPDGVCEGGGVCNWCGRTLRDADL